MRGKSRFNINWLNIQAAEIIAWLIFLLFSKYCITDGLLTWPGLHNAVD